MFSFRFARNIVSKIACSFGRSTSVIVSSFVRYSACFSLSSFAVASLCYRHVRDVLFEFERSLSTVFHS